MKGNQSKIFVIGLASQTQSDSLWNYFEQFGEIQEAVVIKGTSTGYGFVTFKDSASTSRALEDSSPLIDGTTVNSSLVTFDTYARTQNMQETVFPPSQSNAQMNVFPASQNPSPSLQPSQSSTIFHHHVYHHQNAQAPAFQNSFPFGISSMFGQPSQSSSVFHHHIYHHQNAQEHVPPASQISSTFGQPPQSSSIFHHQNVRQHVFPASQNPSPFSQSLSKFNHQNAQEHGFPIPSFQTLPAFARPSPSSSTLNRQNAQENVFAASQISSPFGQSSQRSSTFGIPNSNTFPSSQSSPTIRADHQNPQTDSERIWRNTKSLFPFKFCEMAKSLELDVQTRNENFIFSPCSIQLALCLVANGSTGSTLDEFLTLLEAKDLNHLNEVAIEIIDLLTGGASEGGGPNISFVGGIWVDHGMSLKETFKARAEQIYSAKAKAVDFKKNGGKEVVDEVNKWAEEATNGLIKSLLQPSDVDERTCLALANALYFKGAWSRKFDEKDTKESAFYLLDGSTVMVPFMSSKQKQYIKCYDDFKVLRLPYKRDASKKAAMSMYIILPNRDNGIWNLIEKIGSDLSFFSTYIDTPGSEVLVGEFKLPKFKTTYCFDAREVLQSIGLELPFTGKAEFDEMTEDGELAISKVIHKAQIEVNEEGTEAAAATVVLMMAFGGPSIPPVNFVADHPFVFMVRDDSSGMVLFMGHVINPLL